MGKNTTWMWSEFLPLHFRSILSSFIPISTKNTQQNTRMRVKDTNDKQEAKRYSGGKKYFADRDSKFAIWGDSIIRVKHRALIEQQINDVPLQSA